MVCRYSRFDAYIYNVKKKQAFALKRTLEWLLKELDELKDFDLVNEQVNFHEDIFRQIVQRGDVYDDGGIVYEFVFGIKIEAMGNEKMIWKIK